jgi:uncharacterized protein with GYD domain
MFTEHDTVRPRNDREEAVMPKMMVKASYNAEGTRGLMKEGGSGRRAAIKKLVEGLGGTMEAFYFAYGDADAFLIVDLPDAAVGLALSMAVNASGAVRVTSVPLITAEEMDAACQKSVAYRAPGA